MRIDRAYYNEVDGYCCDWLSNLMDAGLITPGRIDDRPIQEVQAGDVKNYAICHFFAGIGGWDYALQLANYKGPRPVWTGSCPCQPFSTAGKGATTVTYGHIGTVSSKGAALQSYLAKTLRALLAGAGSTLYCLTWKQTLTPRGRRYCQLAVSALRISDKESGLWQPPNGWPTPDSGFGITDANFQKRRAKAKQKRNNGNGFGLTIGQAVQLTHWPTPRANDNVQTNLDEIVRTGSSWRGQGRGATVSTMAKLTSWPTPMARDGKDTTIPPSRDGTGMLYLGMAALLTSWPTPVANDAEKRGQPQANSQNGLAGMVQASWPTPDTMNHRNGNNRRTKESGLHGVSLHHAASWVTPRARDAANPLPSHDRRDKGVRDCNLALARLTTWPTPKQSDANRGGQEKRATTDKHGANLQDFAMTAWATPAATDYKGVSGPNCSAFKRNNTNRLPDQLRRGETLSGSPARTASGGQLNPRFSGWLQGYPIIWDMCAPKQKRKRKKKGKTTKK